MATSIWAVAQALVVFVLVQHFGLWWLAAPVVVLMELWAIRPGRTVPQGRSVYLFSRMPAVLIGLSTVLATAVFLRIASQVVLVMCYAIWRIWWNPDQTKDHVGLVNLLVTQAAWLEAVFLMAAVWRTPTWLVLVCLWMGAYWSVYALLSLRGDRSAGVMAAAWGVITVEVSWVLLSWLSVYTIGGGYVMVPQPALILTAMAYCFGSIYVSQREGSLSRARLGEYLIIGLILIGIVVVGTSWHGSL